MCRYDYSIKCDANKLVSRILTSYSPTFSFLKKQFYAIKHFFALKHFFAIKQLFAIKQNNFNRDYWKVTVLLTILFIECFSM